MWEENGREIQEKNRTKTKTVGEKMSKNFQNLQDIKGKREKVTIRKEKGMQKEISSITKRKKNDVLE